MKPGKNMSKIANTIFGTNLFSREALPS